MHFVKIAVIILPKTTHMWQLNLACFIASTPTSRSATKVVFWICLQNDVLALLNMSTIKLVTCIMRQ